MLVRDLPLNEALAPLVERVRAGTISREAFGLVFSGIVRARGIPFAEATAALNELLGADRHLVGELK